MSVRVGGIDLTAGVVDAQYRVAVLEKVLELVISRLPAGSITDNEIKTIQDEAFIALQKRYPDAGIKREGK